MKIRKIPLKGKIKYFKRFVVFVGLIWRELNEDLVAGRKKGGNKLPPFLSTFLY
jgi:hypothetical protein